MNIKLLLCTTVYENDNLSCTRLTTVTTMDSIQRL